MSRQEAYAGMHARLSGGLAKVKEEDVMDVSDEDQDEDEKKQEEQQYHLSAEIFVFPQPECAIRYRGDAENPDKQRIIYDVDRLPSTLMGVFPQLLNGKASLIDITSDQKRNLSERLCMPMPVHASPAVALISSISLRGSAPYWKPRYVGWMKSCFDLRETVHMIQIGSIPLHESVGKDDSLFSVSFVVVIAIVTLICYCRCYCDCS